MEFPCQFPVKAMGAAGNLGDIVWDIVIKHVPDLQAQQLRTRPSKSGKYLSVTVTIEAQSKEHLDAIYYDLTACEHVIMAL